MIEKGVKSVDNFELRYVGFVWFFEKNMRYVEYGGQIIEECKVQGFEIEEDGKEDFWILRV